MESITKFYAHGKLLITGEYAVLDGALALAIPTKKGQWLEVEYSTNSDNLYWVSKDEDGGVWFEAVFSKKLEILNTSSPEIADKLKSILEACQTLNPSFIKKMEGSRVTTLLEFNRYWGLGSSSTLLHLMGQWAQVNSYKLLEMTFGGSGYDLACAEANSPILYQIIDAQPQIHPVVFSPNFTDNLFFVYLGKKQVSSKEITKYAELKINRKSLCKEVSELTLKVAEAKSLLAFSMALKKHEELLSAAMKRPTIQSEYFGEINGVVKSLGAWGGDFVLFVGQDSELAKFRKLGYTTILKWENMLIPASN